MIDPEEARQALLARKREIAELSGLTRDARDVVALDQQSVGRVSRMDALQGQAMAQASERQRAADLARIDAAVHRIDSGTYGSCLSCDEDISHGRLKADPAASLCISCAASASG
ncbi:TraR/DksA family transcriptional regulator [Stappia stellulata]|uniref:TraR/DksA family transcriptional regulator n=1 Tax=Stappia stellulata TaxID=71235 RepID=UPI0004116DED|nr:TraR/DksA C4-type zinc finger protein [Stappia stellulata]